MKVEHIRLTNFRSHRDYFLENIPRLLIVTGLNASGKSSLLEGLAWALCGATQHTTAAGAGAECLVTDGESRAVAEVGIRTASGLHVVKRSISPKALSVDDSKGGVKRSEELLRALIAPLTLETLLVCLEPHRILSMSDADRRRFLSSVVGVGARTAEQKRQDLAAWLPTQGIPADSDQSRAALAVFDAIPEAQRAYQGFYSARRDNNVVIATHQGQLRDVRMPEGIEGNLEAAIRAAYLELARLVLEMKLAERAETGGHKDMAAIIPKPDMEKLANRVANLRVIESAGLTTIASREQRVALYDSQKHQVTSAAKQCPIFMRECPLSKEEIQGAIKATDEFKTRESKDLAIERRKNTSAKEALQKAEEELTQAKKDLETYKDLWTDDKIQFERVRTKAEITADQANLAVRIKELEEARLNQRMYEMNEGIRRSLEAAKTRTEALETLVAAFSPKGISTMLLSQHLPRLEALATTASRTITRGRYEITFSAMEGELDISVVSGGRRRPIQTLSTSEKIWVSLVIVHTINQLIGNTILVLDEASVLDAALQGGLTEFLTQPLPYETIIVCATTDGGEFLPQVQGADVRRVRLA